MTEQEVDDIMENIESWEYCAAHTTGSWRREVQSLLKHLNRLHELRDAAIYNDLRGMCALARDTIALLKIDEMNG